MLPEACRVHVSPHDGCSDRPVQRKTARCKQENTMSNKSHFVSAAIALATLASVSIATVPAQAAEVVCKTNGVAQGCVAAAAPVVVAPVAATSVTRVAYAATAPVAVSHVGYTRVTPYGVRHVGYTRGWR
jgi:hypothetical protein